MAAAAAVQRRPTLLIIDEIGKNISGAGMDTNVVGRKFNDHVAGRDELPKVKRIIVRGLTEATHGNATRHRHGRVLPQPLHRKDDKITRINCLTGGHPTGAMLPLDYPTDRECSTPRCPRSA